MKKFLSVALATCLALSLFTGCGGKTEAPASAQQPQSSAASSEATAASEPETSGYDTTFGLKPFESRETLRVGFFAGSPLSIPFYIADQEGFFDELNIDIVYETFTNGPAMMEANKNWDIAGAGLGGTLVGMVGHNIKTIGIADYEENLTLLARADSPLAKNPKDPASWKGTTWLYPAGTTAQAVLVNALKNVGLNMTDINSTNMDIASALTAFQGGTGDGLGVWNAIAFRAEDAGFVRITDAGQLGFKAPCATLATDEALANKRELVKTAYAVFYYTWEWCNASEENMNKAVEYYLENCLDEGIACDESIAKRVMEWYRAPFLGKSIEIMAKTVPDEAGLYKTRELLQAESDILVGMDFFITQDKYKPEDRVKMLDNNLVDNSIANEVKEMLDQLGLKY